MRKMTDRQNGTDYLEMWGYLDDDSFVLMRSPLESIRESASLANQFLIYLGIIGMVVGGLLCMDFFKKDHQAGDGIGKGCRKIWRI